MGMNMIGAPGLCENIDASCGFFEGIIVLQKGS